MQDSARDRVGVVQRGEHTSVGARLLHGEWDAVVQEYLVKEQIDRLVRREPQCMADLIDLRPDGGVDANLHQLCLCHELPPFFRKHGSPLII